MKSTLLLTAVLLCGQAWSQEPPITALLSPPKPAAELDRLRALEGHWTCFGVTPAGIAGPESPEKHYVSAFEVKRDLQDFAYIITYVQKTSSDVAPYLTGRWTVGWDGNQKKLLFFWLDNVGSVGLQSVGDWRNGRLIVQGEGFTPAGPATFRDIFIHRDANHMGWKGEFLSQGSSEWLAIGDDDCVKN